MQEKLKFLLVERFDSDALHRRLRRKFQDMELHAAQDTQMLFNIVHQEKPQLILINAGLENISEDIELIIKKLTAIHANAAVIFIVKPEKEQFLRKLLELNNFENYDCEYYPIVLPNLLEKINRFI